MSHLPRIKNKTLIVVLLVVAIIAPARLLSQAVHIPSYPAEVGFARVYSVKNYGAVGNGTTLVSI